MKKFLISAERFLELVSPFVFATAFILFCLYDWNRQNNLLTLRMTIIYFGTGAIITLPFLSCRKVRSLARQLLLRRYETEVKPKIGLMDFIAAFISLMLSYRFPKARINFSVTVFLGIHLIGFAALVAALSLCHWLRTPMSVVMAILYIGIIISMVGILFCSLYDKFFPVKSNRTYAYDVKTGEAIEVEMVEPRR